MARNTELAYRLRRQFQLQMRPAGYWIILVVVGLMVLFPIFAVLQIGFDTSQPGESTRYGLSNWVSGWSSPLMGPALWNTLKILVVRSVIAFSLATFLAWLLTRTDLPFSGLLEFGFWVSFFMPTLAVIQGWMFLLEGQTGVLNIWFSALPFVDEGPFEIFSFWGIIWTHLMSNNITALVILLSLNFRQMDSSLEDAGRVAGSTPLGTLRRVTIPIMRPIFAMLVVLTIIRGFQSFEIEWLLGTPPRIDVFGTLLITFIRDDDPNFGAASALAAGMMMTLVPLILFHRMYLGRRQYTTVSSKMTLKKLTLGRWRWAAFGGVFTLILMLTVVPFVAMVFGSFMTRWGFFGLEPAYTLEHWRTALGDPTFLGSLWSTLILGVIAAFVSVIVLFSISYMLVRVRFAGTPALDFISWLPWAIPGVLLSFGILIMVLNVPALRTFHGSMFSLVMAIVIFRLPLGVQLFKTGLMQVNRELEEASQITGAKWWYTQWRIVLPLLTPMLIAVALLTFISALNEVSGIILLASVETRTLSLLTLDLVFNGEREAAAVITTFIVLMGVGMALLGRRLGFRLG
ncbi:MAG: iron ABC transporter permease [Dehalococcoidia bacterium]